MHCVKYERILVFDDLHFPEYGQNHRLYRKMQASENPYSGILYHMISKLEKALICRVCINLTLSDMGFFELQKHRVEGWGAFCPPAILTLVLEQQ